MSSGLVALSIAVGGLLLVCLALLVWLAWRIVTAVLAIEAHTKRTADATEQLANGLDE